MFQNRMLRPFVMMIYQYQHFHQKKKEIGEGPISLEECTEVLKSFSLNKVPGNDGLPVEFYKTFCGTVGELLVKLHSLDAYVHYL